MIMYMYHAWYLMFYICFRLLMCGNKNLQRSINTTTGKFHIYNHSFGDQDYYYYFLLYCQSQKEASNSTETGLILISSKQNVKCFMHVLEI